MARRKAKYGSKKVSYDGIDFDSKKEMYCYIRFKSMQDDGEISNLRLQVPFEIIPAVYETHEVQMKTKVKTVTKLVQRAAYYVADFVYTDKMDEFEDYIHNKVVMLKSTVMSVFRPDATFEEKKILASVLTSNALSQMAQYIHSDMYRNAWHQKKESPLIEAVTKQSYEFARHFPVSHSVDITASDKVNTMIGSLCQEVIKFLNMKFNEAA